VISYEGVWKGEGEGRGGRDIPTRRELVYGMGYITSIVITGNPETTAVRQMR
jgi:hypothetical protein